MDRVAEQVPRSKDACHPTTVGYSWMAFVTSLELSQAVSSSEIYNPQTMNRPRSSLSWVTMLPRVIRRHVAS